MGQVKISNLLTIIALCTLMLTMTHATSRVAVRSGNWSEASTWQGGIVPVIPDSVIIASNHTVTVDVDYANSLDVLLGGPNDGTLVFPDASSQLYVEGNIVLGGKSAIGTITMTNGLLQLDGTLIIDNRVAQRDRWNGRVWHNWESDDCKRNIL